MRRKLGEGGVYFMANKFYHKLFPEGREEDEHDLAYANEEDDDNYYGGFIFGFGMYNVRFPKENVRGLTEDELNMYARPNTAELAGARFAAIHDRKLALVDKDG